jgi:DeoR family suf operon transcriptional repressor
MCPVDQTTSPIVRRVGDRQQRLLRLLQQEKTGLTVDELAARLQVTATAVRQHLAALERDGYARMQELRKTAGRPGFVYVLTAEGDALFPKQYPWFSSLLLRALREKMGTEELGSFMRGLGGEVAAGLEARMAGKTADEQLGVLMQLMNELGYDARLMTSEAGQPEMVATNCVYHALAREHPEVCNVDYELMERLTGRQVVHTECMVRGGQACRFQFVSPAESKTENN